MLTIRPQQMEIFQAAEEQKFVREVIAHLREKSPAVVEGLNEEELQKRVENGIARARKRYGLKRRIDLLSFILFMFNIAPNFDFYPPVQSLLTDAEIEDDARIDLLIENISDEEWEAARKEANAAAWYINY